MLRDIIFITLLLSLVPFISAITVIGLEELREYLDSKEG